MVEIPILMLEVFLKVQLKFQDMHLDKGKMEKQKLYLVPEEPKEMVVAAVDSMEALPANKKVMNHVAQELEALDISIQR